MFSPGQRLAREHFLDDSPALILAARTSPAKFVVETRFSSLGWQLGGREECVAGDSVSGTVSLLACCSRTM